jgi:hypothetical protein
MTTYFAIRLPSNEVSLVAILSDVTNNSNYCRPKYEYGERYCTLSGYLSNILSSLREYSDASRSETC